VPTVTGLRRARHGRVRVELDGAEWRVLPDDVIVRAGLAVGLRLDRPRLRQLARELRRSRALAIAGRALAARDLSEQGLDERLRRAGVSPATRAEVVDMLRKAGLLDDERLAYARAVALAERGLGDAAIRWDLERRGISPDLADRAVGALEAEAQRARRLVAAHGSGIKIARHLTRKGFSLEAIEAAGLEAVAPEP
jgi:SOS response regulatory protein OraA/RecX